ncbi:rihA, partial [Symbiodinium microadriaticum]
MARVVPPRDTSGPVVVPPPVTPFAPVSPIAPIAPVAPVAPAAPVAPVAPVVPAAVAPATEGAQTGMAAALIMQQFFSQVQ